MGFAEGFGKAFAGTFQTSFQSAVDQADKAREKYLKAKEADEKLINSSKQIATEFGLPADAWRNVYQWQSQGRTVENIRSDLATGRFETMPGAPKPAVTPAAGTTDDQMDNSGLTKADGNTSTTTVSTTGTSTATVKPGENGAIPTVNVESSINRDQPVKADAAAEKPSQAATSSTPVSQTNGATDTQRTLAAMGVYTSPVSDPTMRFIPAPKKVDRPTFTSGNLAAEYIALQDAVRAGKPGAAERLADYETNELPARLRALQLTSNNKEDTDLGRAFLDLDRAKASGDQAKISAAQNKVKVLLDAAAASDMAKNSGDMKRVFTVVNGVPQYADARVMPGTGGQMSYVGADGQPLQGSWNLVTKDHQDSLDRVFAQNQSDVSKYQKDMANLESAVILGQDLIDIVKTDPRALTSVSSMVAGVQSGLREVKTAAQVVGQIFKDNPNAQVTEQQFEQELQAKGILTRGQTLGDIERMDLSKLSLGSDAESLARANNLLQAKIILMAFRAGGLEGQSGNAMSNKDFDRLMTVVKASTDAQTFTTNLNDYLRGRVRSLETMAFQLNSDTTGPRGTHVSLYGYNPVAAHVIPFNQYVTKRGDPRLASAYEMVMNPNYQVQTAPRPAPSAVPPGTTGADGKPVGAAPAATPPAATTDAPAAPARAGATPPAGVQPTRTTKVNGQDVQVQFESVEDRGADGRFAIYASPDGQKFMVRIRESAPSGNTQ